MGRVTILSETTKNPITLIGERAGICWKSDISDSDANYRRGLNCIESGHGRTMEYPNVELVIDGYSARVIREWYTHIGCLPSRLQGSTRYIDYTDFDYITPKSISQNKEIKKHYDAVMNMISKCADMLDKVYNVPREDIAMILPLGMATNIVDKRNLRNLLEMSHQRMCYRAYWEYRDLFKNICDALSDYSEEWKYIIDKYFMPKCQHLGYCPEKKSCGYYERLHKSDKCSDKNEK